VGVTRGCPKFLSTRYYFKYPLLSQERVKLRISNLVGTFKGSIRTEAHKNFGQRGARAYPGAAQNFKVSPISSGTGKAMDFKFGRCIHTVHANKSPLTILDKRERGRIEGLPKILL